MKVDGPNPIASDLKVGFNEETTSAVPDRSNDGAEHTQLQVSVSLSPNNIQSLKTQLSKLPEVRQSRVQALQQKIQSGSYKIDNYQLADAISAELFGPGNSDKP